MNRPRAALIATAAAVTVLATGCQAPSGGSRVVYLVTSDAPLAAVSYTDSEGRTSTDASGDTSWRGAARPPSGPRLSAVPGPGATTVQCTITAGRRVVVQRTSAGSPPAKVDCGATSEGAP